MALPLAMLTSGDRAPPWTVAANTRPKKSGAQVTKEMIYGCSLDYPGPPMDGVIAYPYTTSQKLYRDDFETMIAAVITHPFCRTTVANASSLPHDILAGSAFDDGRAGGISKLWTSEATREFVPRSYIASKAAKPTGVRSECVQFLS